MNIEHLVRMANDISDFFAAEPGGEAPVSSVAAHLKRYWDPRMRRQIIAYFRESGGAGLSEISHAAVAQLAAESAAQEAQSTPQQTR